MFIMCASAFMTIVYVYIIKIDIIFMNWYYHYQKKLISIFFEI